ncbi:hypothetical protein VCHC52A1_0312, partial [Vibrio cholerae HC-52A1]
MVFSSISIK